MKKLMTRYLGAKISTQNNWSKEISIRINEAQKVIHSPTKLLTSKMLSRKTKARLLYIAIIRQTLVYVCKASTMIKQTERNLRQARRVTELTLWVGLVIHVKNI